MYVLYVGAVYDLNMKREFHEAQALLCATLCHSVLCGAVLGDVWMMSG